MRKDARGDAPALGGRRQIGWATSALLFACYAATMGRDLSFYDSPELALSAVQLGLSHPIGQPLHTLLGALVARLPGLPPLVWLNLLSAAAAALAVKPALRLAGSLLEGHADPAARRPAAILALTLGALSLHFVIWDCGTRVEVYSLAALLSLWTMALVDRTLRGPAAAGRSWLLAGVLLGLCGAANGYTAALTAVAVAPACAAGVLRGQISRRAVLCFVIGCVAGLLPYLYVPLVSHREGVIVWGEPRDLGRLWFYFRGADYGHNRGITGAEYGAHLASWTRFASANGVLALLALGGLAPVVLGASRLRFFAGPLLLVSTVALLCSHVVFSTDILDYSDYLMPGLLGCGAGIAALVAAAVERGGRARVLGLSCLAAVVLLSLTAAPGVAGRTRARDRTARHVALAALTEAPAGAILIVEADHWVWPLLYLQEAERVRPDVTLLAYGLASSSWYWNLLWRRHPDLPRIALADPNGRAGRVRRFLAAAGAERPIAVESIALAREAGLPVCDVGALLIVRPCGAAPDGAGRATALLDGLLRAVEQGSPPADAVLARIGERRGEALWRLSRPDEALRAYYAGVPTALAPREGSPVDAPSPAALGPIPSPRIELERWLDPPAIGDPRRNLYLSGLLLLGSSTPKIGMPFLLAAAEHDLPEANSLLLKLREGSQ